MSQGHGSGHGRGGAKPRSPAQTAEVENLRQKVTDLVGQDPKKAAIILSDWLKAGENTAARATKTPVKGSQSGSSHSGHSSGHAPKKKAG